MSQSMRIGIGADRCGTASPAKLRHPQHDTVCSCDEPPRLSWRRIQRLRRQWFAGGFRVCLGLALLSAMPLVAAEPQDFASTWPQAYTVRQDAAAGTLALSTPFYTVCHDLKHGGAITSIRLTHGREANLLRAPIETRVRDEHGRIFSDVNDRAPRISNRPDGLSEVVTVERELCDQDGRGSGIKVKTVLNYRWGYVKSQSVYTFPAEGFNAAELSVVRMQAPASLTDYGYREGLTEAEGMPPFAFGSCKWGKTAKGAVLAKFLPRYWMFANPGVEGIEWFMGSDLSQWDIQLTGRRGDARCLLEPIGNRGLLLTLSPLFRAKGTVLLTKSCAFDFYFGLPLLEGHAWQPWLHAIFSCNQGKWVSPEQIRDWAEKGVQTVHCHNDGDAYGDGLFWRDGSYPPYPEPILKNFDKVLAECRNAGIRTATYFSNKELHPSTDAFQQHGDAWARKDQKGNRQHNLYQDKGEYGAQMCLRSGWLAFLKSSIDRVLSHHKLDGVYYDWNVALLCSNPLHEGLRADQKAAGHWDIDELLDLMEWTRHRVGPKGMVIVHDTTTPMFALENFANYVVANEWGYGKWSENGPELKELPLEWSLVGARPRGVISYGQLDAKSPRRLYRVFALNALVAGVTPWPTPPETFNIFSVLKPIGNLQDCRFADWRNTAVSLQGPRVASAVYSRPNEAWIVVANTEAEPREVLCALHPDSLPYPLRAITEAVLIKTPNDKQTIDAAALTTQGIRLQLPPDGAVLLLVR